MTYAGAGQWTFSGNTYQTTESDGSRFYYNISNVSDATWVSTTSDDYGSLQIKSYPDSTKDVDTYNASIGGTGTVAAFIIAVRTQSYLNWDTRYEADRVNDWIRDGFFPVEGKGVSIHSGSVE